MSCDGYQTDDVFFSAALEYIFGESLTRITIDEDDRGRRKTYFHHDAPSLDCQIYFEELQKGQLNIADLMSYVKQYTKLVGTLKNMRRNDEMEWTSPAWIRGRG